MPKLLLLFIFPVLLLAQDIDEMTEEERERARQEYLKANGLLKKSPPQKTATSAPAEKPKAKLKELSAEELANFERMVREQKGNPQTKRKMLEAIQAQKKKLLQDR